MLYDMETYDARGNLSGWNAQYAKFVNSSLTDAYGDAQRFPIAQAGVGFDVYEPEASALLGPRVARLVADGVPELFVFQFWLQPDGTVMIPPFWWEGLAAYKGK